MISPGKKSVITRRNNDQLRKLGQQIREVYVCKEKSHQNLVITDRRCPLRTPAKAVDLPFGPR